MPLFFGKKRKKVLKNIKKSLDIYAYIWYDIYIKKRKKKGRQKMKAKIKGKVYDTKKSALLAHHEYGDIVQSPRTWSETALYKTSRGDYFLYGDGGDMTYFSGYDPATGGTYRGEMVLALTNEAAGAYLDAGGRMSVGDLYRMDGVTGESRAITY